MFPADARDRFTTLVAGACASVAHDEHDGIRLNLHVRATLRDRLLAGSADI
jgi:hypothetical protein